MNDHEMLTLRNRVKFLNNRIKNESTKLNEAMRKNFALNRDLIELKIQSEQEKACWKADKNELTLLIAHLENKVSELQSDIIQKENDQDFLAITLSYLQVHGHHQAALDIVSAFGGLSRLQELSQSHPELKKPLAWLLSNSNYIPVQQTKDNRNNERH